MVKSLISFLYQKKRTPNHTKIKIFGIPVWMMKKKSLNTEKFLFGIRYYTNQQHEILRKVAFVECVENKIQQDMLSVNKTLADIHENSVQNINQILQRLDCIENHLQQNESLVNKILTYIENHLQQNESLVNKILTYIENQLQQDVLFVNRMLAVAHANAIQDTHQKTFSKYKNCHHGKDVVLIATGPTLSFFTPISNCVYVGVNKAVMYDKVHLDYVFFQDAAYPHNEYKEAVNNYPNAKKFYGILQDCIQTEWILSESDAIKADAERYYVISQWKYPPVHFTYDIANEPLGCNGTVSYAAMQFILWTNPRKIYLVGQDCTTTYWDKSTSILTSNQSTLWEAGWVEMAKFIKTYYPETEIISVNPVGLKGLFHDVYTESYLKEHPEIATENPEILKTGVLK